MKTLFPVQKSILSCEAIKENLLSLYAIEENYTCRFFRNGVNDTYKIEGESINYYLRIYRFNLRRKEDIISEINLLNHLGESDQISVATPIKKKDGSFLTELNTQEGLRYAVLFKSVIGKPKLLNAEISFIFGKTAAIIHAEADKIGELDRIHMDLEHLLDEPLKNIKPFLSKRQDDYKYLEITAKKLSSKINNLLSKDKSIYGLCHGDFHNGNVFFDSEDNTSVFDFDSFGYGWRAYDISVFLWSCGSSRLWKKANIEYRARLWNSYIEGYSSIKNLSKEELEAAFIFVPIRHIWLLGLHTHGCNDWGGEWINDEYFDRHIMFIKKWIEQYEILSQKKKQFNFIVFVKEAIKSSIKYITNLVNLFIYRKNK